MGEKRVLGGLKGLRLDGSEASTFARCQAATRGCLRWKGCSMRWTTLKILIKESPATSCQEHLKSQFGDLHSNSGAQHTHDPWALYQTCCTSRNPTPIIGHDDLGSVSSGVGSGFHGITSLSQTVPDIHSLSGMLQLHCNVFNPQKRAGQNEEPSVDPTS